MGRFDDGINSYHPECAENERFICFATAAEFKEIGWSTKRIGEPIVLFPIFAKLSELEQKHPGFQKKKCETSGA
jgi:hypothetical protein